MLVVATPENLTGLLPGAELHETHASWVLVGDTEAVKVKKPVVMPFLDYGTPERRRAACRAEVTLNRRLAPDVYRGVASVVPAGDGFALADEDDPRAVDYAVRMRRYDEANTLAARVAAGALCEEELERIGAHLARFHAGTDRASAGAEPVKRWVDDNHASLLALLEPGDGRRRVVASERFFASFLDARWQQLDERSAAGQVRDGHGDLRAEHVLLEGDRIVIVDCIEFEPALRRIDVGCDLAFLVMDLMAAGRADLATALSRGYREAGGDPGDDALVWAFAAYRAQVRAKVALLRAAQQPAPTSTRIEEEAVRLLTLAERLSWLSRGPVTFAIAGLSASGKTTLARALGERSALPHVSSDVVRKVTAGMAPYARAPAALYTPAVNAAVYEDLGRIAPTALDGLIIDATFRSRADRATFAGAHGRARRVVYVECVTPERLRLARAHARELNDERVSDAGTEVAARQRMEPFDEIAPEDHVVVRGDAPLDAQVAAVADALDRRLLPT